MKAILEFNLDDPDDKIRHEMACKASEMSTALHEFGRVIRNRIKYGEFSEEVGEHLESVMRDLNDIIDELEIRTIIES